MATTQFAMVEELASLIKDNLHSKHLILSIEEALINLLQDGTSSDGILELRPMSPYHRLLLHRLADIYGFAHESVGEGDDRHLVLERCADTTIPPILVSDILWQCDEQQPLSTSKFIIRRNEAPAFETMHQLSPSTPLEEREASYRAARERIFSLHQDGEQDKAVPKSRKVPVVARRMIAHALGQRISSLPVEKLSMDENGKEVIDGQSSAEGDGLHSNVQDSRESNAFAGGKLDVHEKRSRNKKPSSGRNSVEYKKECTAVSSKNNLPPNESSRRVLGAEDLKKQQAGAARRIFANAMGLSSGKGTQDLLMKPNEGSIDYGRET